MPIDPTKLVRIAEVTQYHCLHCNRWWTPKKPDPARCGRCKVAGWWKKPLYRRQDGKGPSVTQMLKAANKQAKKELAAHYVCLECRLVYKATCCCCHGCAPKPGGGSGPLTS